MSIVQISKAYKQYMKRLRAMEKQNTLKQLDLWFTGKHNWNVGKEAIDYYRLMPFRPRMVHSPCGYYGRWRDRLKDKPEPDFTVLGSRLPSSPEPQG